MKRKVFVFSLVTFLVSQTAVGQGNQILTLLDDETHRPIAYAHIYIEGSLRGVVSNAEGEFVWDETFSQSSHPIIIQHIGYEKMSINPQKGKGIFESKVIKMRSITPILDEVVVLDKDGLSLVQQSLGSNVDHLLLNPVNFFKTYYREYVKIDSSYTKYADGLIDYRTTYKKNKLSVCPTVLQSRTFDFTSDDEKQLSVFSPIGFKSLMEYNLIDGIGKFFSAENFSKYLYALNPAYKNPDYWEVTITPVEGINEPLYTGRVIIDKKSGTIKEIEYKTDPTLAQYNKERSLLGITSRLLGQSCYIQYALDNGDAYLKYARISMKIYFESSSLGSKSIEFKSEVLAYDKTGIDLKQKCYKDKSLFKNGNQYDHEFWDTGFAIPTTKNENRMLQSLIEKTNH